MPAFFLGRGDLAAVINVPMVVGSDLTVLADLVCPRKVSLVIHLISLVQLQLGPMVDVGGVPRVAQVDSLRSSSALCDIIRGRLKPHRATNPSHQEQNRAEQTRMLASKQFTVRSSHVPRLPRERMGDINSKIRDEGFMRPKIQKTFPQIRIATKILHVRGSRHSGARAQHEPRDEHAIVQPALCAIVHHSNVGEPFRHKEHVD
jgi:hypothetical protein